MKSTVVARSPWFMVLMAALGTGWIILAANSDHVPWGSNGFWWLACGLAAGAATGLGFYRTLFAARSYAVITTILGAIRSLAYLSDNAGGPAAVWYIYAVTTSGAYLLLAERASRAE